jgi:hypothetical protein
MIIKNLAKINMALIDTKSLLNNYQKHSMDFKFEENMRMTEIKKFADDVIPKSKFIFDNYKMDDAKEEGL